jgi:hypothetical protein
MRKLKAKEWVQLILMFPLAIWGVHFLGRWGSASLDNMGISSADMCYASLYKYSGQDPYIAVLCTVPNEGIAIIRAHAESLALMATNHPIDLLAISVVFFASMLAWLLFLKRVVAVYVPGI